MHSSDRWEVSTQVGLCDVTYLFISTPRLMTRKGSSATDLLWQKDWILHSIQKLKPPWVSKFCSQPILRTGCPQVQSPKPKRKEKAKGNYFLPFKTPTEPRFQKASERFPYFCSWPLLQFNLQDLEGFKSVCLHPVWRVSWKSPNRVVFHFHSSP